MNKISILTCISVLAMVTGMLVQLVIAMQLGAGAERDSLFVAMSVPLFVNTLLIGTVGVVITPVIVSHRSLNAQRRLIFRVLCWMIFGAAIVAVVFCLGRGFFARLLAPGFGEPGQVHTAQMLILAVLILPIQAVSTVLAGFLVARERVFLPTIAQVLGNTVTLGLVVLAGSSLTANAVIMATLAGVISTALIQSSILWTRDAAIADSDDVDTVKGVAVSTFYQRTAPLLISGVISRSIPLVERNLASSMGVGTISCLGYAGYLVSFLVNATTGPTATACFARMCSLWNEGMREEVGAILEKNLKTILAMSLSAAGAFILVAPELARLVPRFSRFSAGDAQELMTYCRILMIAYCVLACGGLLSRLFYVVGASARMATLECLTTALYVIMAITLARNFKGYGLVSAASLHAVIAVGLFAHWARSQFTAHLRRRFYFGVFSIVFKWALALCLSLIALRELEAFIFQELATGLTIFLYGVSVVWLLFRDMFFRSGVVAFNN